MNWHVILPILFLCHLTYSMPQNELRNSGKWKPDGSNGECGTRITSSSIVGGRITKLGDYPWMVLLGSPSVGFDNKIRYGCGATIINKWYVLTAAHCLDDGYEKVDIVEVVLGEHTLGTDPDCEENQGVEFCAPKIIKRKVAKSILHEDWNPKTIENDIALLRLDQPVPLYSDDPKLSNVLPVCLPWNEFDPGRDIESWAEEPAIVTGWGRITNDLDEFTEDFTNNKAGSQALKQATVPIKSTEFCENVPEFGFNNLKFDKRFCAGGVEGQDSCTGDSGGPIILKEFTDDPYFQIGIVSFSVGNECGAKNLPGVYTNVESYLDWIDSKLEI